MSYTKAKSLQLTNGVAIDISDASDTTQFTFEAPHDMIVYRFWGTYVTETVGTVTVTEHGSLSHDAVEKSVLTAIDGSTVGNTESGTQFAPFKVAAGETLVFKTKTQDAAIAGELLPFVYAEEFPNISPA